MCGIVGFCGMDQERIGRLTRLMAHRGPDDEGWWVDQGVSFGHRRLSVLDLSPAGHQPMCYHRTGGAFSATFNPSHQVAYEAAIVYNGEIYNFHELRDQLQAYGYRFATRSDTEVLLAGYLQWGLQLVQHLNGIWAFCLFDPRQKRLLLSRDRLGEKPLYYLAERGRFMFGSELKPFLTDAAHKQIDARAMQHYLLFGFTPADRSMLAGVCKLRPGELVVYDLQTQAVSERQRYWQVTLQPTVGRLRDVAPQLLSLIEDSVRLRLVSDVPVGAFLSGGIDSSIIVACMRKQVTDLKTFSVRFDHEAYNESSWAALVSRQFHTDHHEVAFSAQEVVGSLDHLVYAFDEPFGDPSMIPTYLVSKVARQHVTVCLSGTGGDELFAGYPRHLEFLVLRMLRRLPRPAQRALAGVYRLASADKARKLAVLLASQDDLDLYLKLFSFMFRDERETHPELATLGDYSSYFTRHHGLDAALAFDQSVYLPDDLLVKEDRATMAHGLEGRIPFLDYRLVDLANSLRPSLRLRYLVKKYVLKRLFRGTLPLSVLHRRKQGFAVPLPEYFRGALKDLAYDRLFERPADELYDRTVLRGLWDRHQAGRSDYSRILWALLMLNLWRDRWMV